MNSEKISDAINEVGDKYYEEAVVYHGKKRTWVKWAGIAACLAVAVFAALPNLSPSKPANIHLGMDKVYINELETSSGDGSRTGYDEDLYDCVTWDKKAIAKHFGRDLTPAYIPDGLTAGKNNGTASVYVEKGGKLVDDTVWLEYYHGYYPDGSPKLTDNTAAQKGFTIEASKLGIVDDCYIVMPQDAKATDINGTKVIFGHFSVPYGPYDDNDEPAGYYDMYVVKFKLDGVEYRITAEQLSEYEVVKTVSSIIYGQEISVDK